MLRGERVSRLCLITIQDAIQERYEYETHLHASSLEINSNPSCAGRMCQVKLHQGRSACLWIRSIWVSPNLPWIFMKTDQWKVHMQKYIFKKRDPKGTQGGHILLKWARGQFSQLQSTQQDQISTLFSWNFILLRLICVVEYVIYIAYLLQEQTGS